MLLRLDDLDLWAFGPLGRWTFGPLDLWPFGPLARWTLGPLTLRTFGPPFDLYLWTSLLWFLSRQRRRVGAKAEGRPGTWQSHHITCLLCHAFALTAFLTRLYTNP